MRILRNKRTGEVVQVEDSEAQSYLNPQTQINGSDMAGGMGGIDPDMANSIIQQYLMQAMSSPGSTAAGRSLTQASALKDLFGLSETAEQKNKKMSKSDGARVLEVLENAYFLNKRGPLSYADKGVGGRASGFAEEVNAKLSADYNPELLSYTQLLESSRPMFAKAAGDVGNMSQSEQQVAISSIPKGRNSYEEAKQFFNMMRKRMNLPERDFDSEVANAGLTGSTKGNGQVIPLPIKKTKTSRPTYQQPVEEGEIVSEGGQAPDDRLSAKILKGKGLPIATSVLGSLVGGFLGPMGSVGGAAAGYGGGDVIRRGLADLLDVDLGNDTTIARPKGTTGSKAVNLLSGPAIAGGTTALFKLHPLLNQLKDIRAGGMAPLAGKEILSGIKSGTSSFKGPGTGTAAKKFMGQASEMYGGKNVSATSALARKRFLGDYARNRQGEVRNPLIDRMLDAERRTLSNLLKQKGGLPMKALEAGDSALYGGQKVLGSGLNVAKQVIPYYLLYSLLNKVSGQRD